MKPSTGQKLLAISAAAALLVALAGCKKSDTVTYGQVTAVNGSSVTLALGTMRTRSGFSGRGGGRRGGSGTNGNGPGGGQGSVSGGGWGGMPESVSGGGQGGMPAGAVSGQIPSMSSGGFGGQGGGFSPLTLTGKTETIQITDASVLKKEERRGFGETSGASAATSSASLSDVQTGSVLEVTTGSSGKITSIVIMSFGGGGRMGGRNGAVDSSAGG